MLHQPRKLSKEEINALPIGKWEGPVRLIRTQDQAREAAHALASESIIGFDTETRPAYRKGESHPPALLQLAGESEVYIFQLAQTGLPGPLRKILSDPEIIKAGVSLAYDLCELKKLTPFRPAGFVELASLARKAGIPHHGLRGLAASLLGFRLAKGAQTSNWARTELTPAQISYAATDAWAGRELYLHLNPWMFKPGAG